MAQYNDVFGGANINPSEASYVSVTLTSDRTFGWATESSALADVIAGIMDVVSDGAVYSLTLPDARSASPGETILFNNKGSFSFNVKSNTDVQLVSIAPGEAWQVYLTNNTTQSGVWTAFQYGAGVSSADAASLVGAGLVATGSTLAQKMPVSPFNSNYSAGASDRSSTQLWTGAGGTLTLPDPGDANVGEGWFVQVVNQGSGALIVDPAGSILIDGLSTKVFNPADSAVVFTDGFNYFSVGFGRSPVFGFDYTSVNVAGTGNRVLVGSELNRIAYSFDGVLTGNRNVIVPTTIQQYWVTNNTTGPFTLTVKTLAGVGRTIGQGQAAIFYSNGVDVVIADTGGISTPIAIIDGGTGSMTANGALVNLGGTSTGIGVFTAATQAAARTAIGFQDGVLTTVSGGTF